MIEEVGSGSSVRGAAVMGKEPARRRRCGIEASLLEQQGSGSCVLRTA
jgi:hypothetical protein